MCFVCLFVCLFVYSFRKRENHDDEGRLGEKIKRMLSFPIRSFIWGSRDGGVGSTDDDDSGAEGLYRLNGIADRSEMPGATPVPAATYISMR